MTSGAPVRVALVGAGVIGERHAAVLATFSDEVQLVAVVNRGRDRGERLAATYGGRWFGSLEAALSTVPVDLVVVCTPTGQHSADTLTALAAGRHVLVEKPAELNLERIDAMIAAQERAGTCVAVVSQHRFDVATEAVLGAVQRGELGRITSGTASIDWWRGQAYYDSAPWRGTWALDGGGALMNQGVHTVDLLIAALGEPVEVFAYAATLAHQRLEVEDVAVAVVRFANGALASIHASTAAYPSLGTRLQIHGDRGSAVIIDDELHVLHTTPAGHERAELPFGLPPGTATRPEPTTDPGPDSLRRQYEDLFAAVRGDHRVAVGLVENRRAVALILGAYESVRTGRPVDLECRGGGSSGQPR